jgi:peptide/nickel transport system ATP-binding protein
MVELNSAANLLEVKGLRTHIRTRHATVKAVDGVSLEIRPGETVGLVGESGCGKSMTGMSIMRLLPPGGHIVGGSVRLDGREITTLSSAEMRRVRGNEIAMVFQDPMTSLNPTMTIGAQIAEPACIHLSLSKSEAWERAVEVLTLVGMPRPLERLKAYPHQLSGGLRQRVMIAMALACRPKLLIADEPTTALDVTIQDQILRLLDDLKAQLGMGLLLITHDMGVIAGRADRVMVMYAGRIVESGDTEKLFHDMRHPYSEALLESIPDLRTDRSKVLYSIPGLPPDLAHPPDCCRFAPRCRYTQGRCQSEDPVLGGNDPGHPFACFFPVRGPKAEEQPNAVPGGDGETDGGVSPRLAAGAANAVGVLPESGRGISVTVNRAPPDNASVSEPLLVLDHVVKEFPITKGVLQRRVGSVKAVSDVSFDIARGETFGLVGESGCGKTTLGRLITVLEKLDSGTVRFDGNDISGLRGGSLRRLRQDLQLMFQDPYASLDPRMRIQSILREPLVAQRIGSKQEQVARIRELLREVGLGGDTVGLYPHEFSGGQRQRIGFARALTVEPRLIVADEPVSALDVSIQSQVLNLMKRLQAERDLTYIIISHDLSVVRYMADRIGIMYLGKLVEIGPASETYGHPAHPYTAALLEAIPEPNPVTERARAKGQVAISGDLPSAAHPPSGCRFRTRCPRAQAICAEIEPILRPFNVAGHQAACHFPLQTPLNLDASQAATRAGRLTGSGGVPPASPGGHHL